MASLLPYSGSLGRRLAKHLLRRATYSVTKTRIDEFSNYSVDQALTELLILPEKNLIQPIHFVAKNLTQPSPWINDDPIYGPVNVDNGSGQLKKDSYLAGWWIDEAKRDTSLRSKMSYFLFTDFTAAVRFLQSPFYYDYLMLIEFFCLGDWKEFCFQMTKNNVMLKYLDNNDNTKGNPNENFAREVLELFTIGKGVQTGIGDYTNYTESDIEQAAKVLTGWTFSKDSDRNLRDNGAEFGNIPCGYVNSGKHDFGRKEFSHRFGNYVIDEWNASGKSEEEKVARTEAELKEFIDMVLNQAETAKFICRKLYRFFVSRKITTEIENDIIVPLANTFRANYNLEPVITQLLKSEHFYDADDSDNTDEIVGGLVKSPLDLVTSVLSTTAYPVPHPITQGEWHYKKFYYNQILDNVMIPAAQDLFRPPSVAGFPPYYESPEFDRFWFNSSTIISRYNLANILLDPALSKATFYVSTFVDANVSNPGDPSVLIDELVDLLFPEPIDASRKSFFLNDILLDNGSETAEMWTDEWINFKNTGSTTGVESALRPLFRALIWSQEFQNH